jgi:hypothetical protein
MAYSHPDNPKPDSKMKRQIVETLKWLGTVTLILGTAVNGLNFYPQGVLVLALGGAFWLTAAVMIRDRPLIVTNLVMSLTGLTGVVYNTFV